MRRTVLAGILFFVFAAAAVEAGVRSCPGSKGVNILLIDNSRSVPHMDPSKDRITVLRELLDYLKGSENRLILFGGTREIVVDKPEEFRNDALHTDYYGALEEALRIRHEYPSECDIRIILVTDGLLDPGLDDYPGQKFTMQEQVKAFSREQTLDLLEKSHIPVFFILLGTQGDMDFIRSMSIRANGYFRASPFMESAAAFLGNNGTLFRQFIFVHEPYQGMSHIQKVLHTIVQADKPYLEIILFGVPFLALFILVTLLLRTFPAYGDIEEVQLAEGVPVFVGADLDDPGSVSNPDHISRRQGLKCVSGTGSALASIILQRRHFDFSSKGLVGLDKLDPFSRRLLDEDVTRLAERLKKMEESGRDDEVIVATDLRYYCSNLELERIRSILQARESDRMDINCKDFLLAKVYISLAPDLLEEFTEYKVFITIPGRNIIRAQVKPGQKYPFGRYLMRVEAVEIDSRYSARVLFAYHGVPSFLWLKRLVPGPIQKVLRFRRARKSVFNPA